MDPSDTTKEKSSPIASEIGPTTPAKNDSSDGSTSKPASTLSFEDAMEKLKREQENFLSMQKAMKKAQEDAQSSNRPQDSEEADARSVHVSQLDYSATVEDVKSLFQSCGTIHRVTIPINAFTGSPKGYAYVEFTEPDAVQNALVLSGTTFKDRKLRVTLKRTNVPAFQLRGGRGRHRYPSRYGGRSRYRRPMRRGRFRARKAYYSASG